MDNGSMATTRPCRAVAGAVAFALAMSAGAALGNEVKVRLSGDQEIPPVTTSASGTATFAVAPDGSASGRVTVSGVKVTVAHIHEAPAGKNGPIVIPLVKASETEWTVPPGVKLTEAQLASYRAGNLYYNMHSEAWRAGEIRGQIRP